MSTTLMVCEDCFFAHHYGKATAGGRWFAGDNDTPCDQEPLRLTTGLELTDDTDVNTGDGIDTFSKSWCDGCGSHLAGARYRLASEPIRPTSLVPGYEPGTYNVFYPNMIGDRLGVPFEELSPVELHRLADLRERSLSLRSL